MNTTNLERSATDRNKETREYEIIDTNAQNIGGCRFCGYKPGSKLGHRRKTDWLKERYAEGLRCKVLRSQKFGDIGMIEYAPGNHAWRPVEAEGYFVIHCIMVNSKHKGKGLGMLLLDSCLRDAKKSKCRGVAVVTSSDGFMARRDFFIKAGFIPVDSSPPYELLVKKLKATAPDPRFIVQRERVLKRYKKGLTILAADQCPAVPKWVADIAEMSRTLGLEPKVVPVRSAKASRELPTPYGMFSILYDGKLIADRPVSARRFSSMMHEHSQSGTNECMVSMKPQIIDVGLENVEQTGFFCFMSKRKNPGWKAKLLWLKQRFREGLRLKLLKMPRRGFIEYIPGEFAWRPVEAKGYMFIHCLWVVGQSRGKGFASALLEQCMADARRSNMDGLAMVVSDIGYMKWKRFLLKHGFEAVDVAPPCYQLMALRFGDMPWPKFSGDWEKKARACGKGVTILKTSQCPYFEDATVALLRIAQRKKIPAKVIALKSARDVRHLAPSPYGTYNVVIDGQAVPSHDQARAALLAH
jgi:N-acetylglutamate synthase-like GNAT family acetyltransferase